MAMWLSAFFLFLTIFVSSHRYPGNLEETRVIAGSMNMGYDIYLTLPLGNGSTFPLIYQARLNTI